MSEINTFRIVEFVNAGTVQHLRSFINQLKGDSIEIYINTTNGEPLQVIEVCNELKKIKSVGLKIGSVCGGSVSYLLTQFHAHVEQTTQIMLQSPRMVVSGDIKECHAQLELLKNIESEFIQAFSKKINRSVEDVRNLLLNGDVWLNYNEAVKIGLVNGKIDFKSNEIEAIAQSNDDYWLKCLEDESEEFIHLIIGNRDYALEIINKYYKNGN